MTTLSVSQIISNLRQRLVEENYLCEKTFVFKGDTCKPSPKNTMKLSCAIAHLERGGSYRIVGSLLITKFGPIAI